MKRFTDAGRQAIEADNLYCALSLALMIPDICGSLEDPGPGKSKQRYVAWYTKWALPKFTFAIGPTQTKTVFVTADDCFQLRCSLIHSGSTQIEPGKQSNLNHFLFFDKTLNTHLNSVQNGQDKYVQLRADLFSEELFKAADEWGAAASKIHAVQQEKIKLLSIHSSGYVYGGIKFG